MAGPNPSGLCVCGCGTPTRLAPESRASLGWVRGEPIRFVKGHSGARRVGLVEGTDYVVEQRGFDTPCWVWQRSLKAPGYGQMRRGMGFVGAHRWVYEREIGPIPEGCDVHHRCEVKACVNPGHLEALTPVAHGLLHAAKRVAA